MLELDASNCTSLLLEDWLTSRLGALEDARIRLREGSGLGGTYIGRVHLPRDYDRGGFVRIQAATERIRSDSQTLVIIGIGDSYLGTRAVVELLHSPNFNLTHKGGPDIYFAGNGLSSDIMLEVIELVKDKDFSISVISKSGTATELTVAFRIFKALLEEKYGKEGARRRIYAATDTHKGALKNLVNVEGYEESVMSDVVSGRYSAPTAVGPLSVACTGVDIAALMKDAAQAIEVPAIPGADNPAWQHAAVCHALRTQGRRAEVLVEYEFSFRLFGKWWKQLFGKIEGKNSKVLFPASAEFIADLRSMGQYIQQDERPTLEAVIRFVHSRGSVTIPHDSDNVNGLSFLASKGLSFVAEQAVRGTLLTHVDDSMSNLMVTAPARDAQSVDWLIYSFGYACDLSGYLLEVNPFDQPGVETHRNSIYTLLGKPGYEDRKVELEARL